MKLLKKLLANLIFSNLYVSLAAGLISAGINSFLHYPFSIEIGLFIFSSTLSIYSFQRLVKYKLEEKRESELNTWIEKNQIIQIIYISLSSLLSIYLYFFILKAFDNTKWWMIISFLLSVMYAVKMKGVSLRDIPYIKIHLIAIVWCKALFFPIVLQNDYTTSNLAFISSHYFFFIALCIPFDIRDLNYDNLKLRTLPQLIGVSNSRFLSMFSMLIFGFLCCLVYPSLKQNSFFLIGVLSSIFTLSFSNVNRNSFYYGILVDGLIILIGLSYFL